MAARTKPSTAIPRTLRGLERRNSRSSPYLGSFRRELHHGGAPRNDRFHRRPLPRRLRCGQGNDATASLLQTRGQIPTRRHDRALRTQRPLWFYFSVVEEGEVGAGDEFELLGREEPTLTIGEINELYTAKLPDRETLERSLHVKLLPENWRMRFRARLADTDGRKHDGHTSPV